MRVDATVGHSIFQLLLTITVITTDPNEVVHPMRDRMPVIKKCVSHHLAERDNLGHTPFCLAAEVPVLTQVPNRILRIQNRYRCICGRLFFDRGV
jgi:putative SOS response-associated peptidase YedK